MRWHHHGDLHHPDWWICYYERASQWRARWPHPRHYRRCRQSWNPLRLYREAHFKGNRVGGISRMAGWGSGDLFLNFMASMDYGAEPLATFATGARAFLSSISQDLFVNFSWGLPVDVRFRSSTGSCQPRISCLHQQENLVSYHKPLKEAHHTLT